MKIIPKDALYLLMVKSKNLPASARNFFPFLLQTWGNFLSLGNSQLFHLCCFLYNPASLVIILSSCIIKLTLCPSLSPG